MSRSLTGSERIIVLTQENPKRKGSRARRAFSRMQSEMTVNDFILRIGDRQRAIRELRWDERAGYIRLG